MPLPVSAARSPASVTWRYMGAYGRRRVEERLAWAHQERNYLSVYAAVSGLSKVRVA